MKNLLSTTTIAVMLSLSGCSEKNEIAPDNGGTFTLNGTTYKTSFAYSENFGSTESGYYETAVLLTSKEVDLEADEFNGIDVVFFDLVTEEEDVIPEGTYKLDHSGNSYTMTGYIGIDVTGSLLDNPFENIFRFSQGSVTVEKERDNYIFNYSFTDENNISVSGSHSGNINPSE
ncbi:MAG: hypothetical protein RIM99_08075 [Cyclobacteriaceae bacterium]